jgi:phosphate transport system permease protein
VGPTGDEPSRPDSAAAAASGAGPGAADTPVDPTNSGGGSDGQGVADTGETHHALQHGSGITLSGPRVVGSSSASSITTFEDTEPVSGSGLSAFSSGSGRARIGDRVFGALTAGSGLFIVILIGLVAVFLIAKAAPAISDDKSNFLFSRDWNVDGANLHFGIVGLLWVTVLISIVAMILAFPIAIGIALFITHYAPRQLARPVAYVVDLLAAIPSIVYGIWGIIILAPKLEPVQRFFYHLGFIPFFKDRSIASGTIFNGGVVLAVMILPIMTAISRDVFERTPRANIEAAWALGATKWEMIRLAVLPFGRPGLISGAMLGLGRALGETIAITLILSKPGDGSPFTPSIFANGETFASKIANNAAEFNDPKQTGAFIAAGLVLFVLTFAVNAAARSVVNRRKEFS